MIVSFSAWYSVSLKTLALLRLCSSDNCLYNFERSSINLLELSCLDNTGEALPEKDDVMALAASTMT